MLLRGLRLGERDLLLLGLRLEPLRGLLLLLRLTERLTLDLLLLERERLLLGERRERRGGVRARLRPPLRELLLELEGLRRRLERRRGGVRLRPRLGGLREMERRLEE